MRVPGSGRAAGLACVEGESEVNGAVGRGDVSVEGGVGRRSGFFGRGALGERPTGKNEQGNRVLIWRRGLSRFRKELILR